LFFGGGGEQRGRMSGDPCYKTQVGVVGVLPYV
jgi:hypothetical protein